ncbi:MAG: PTS sugar transporter subunit IIA [Acidobacteriota bacterium]
MIGILILTHGCLARELLAAARTISTGDLERFEALCLDWDATPEAVRRTVDDHIERLDRGQGVLILTDIFGGTPCNAAMAARQPGRIEVIAGVNLPMVVRLGCEFGRQTRSVDELATWLRDKGRSSITASPDLASSGRRATRRDAAADAAAAALDDARGGPCGPPAPALAIVGARSAEDAP